MVLSVVSIAILCFAGCTEKKSVDTFDTSILPEYSYELNEEKNGVGNIPFEEYLKEKTLPTDKKSYMYLKEVHLRIMTA